MRLGFTTILTPSWIWSPYGLKLRDSVLQPCQGRSISTKAELASHESRCAVVPSWDMGLLATVFLPAFFGVGVSMQMEPLLPSSALGLHRDKPEADILLCSVFA